jgi:hypothetical protein
MAGLLLGIVGGGWMKALPACFVSASRPRFMIGTAPFLLGGHARQPPRPLPKSKRARRRMKHADCPPPPPRRWHFWAWPYVFAMLAVRSFCWLLWIDGNNLKIQSPNNLGDLAPHYLHQVFRQRRRCGPTIRSTSSVRSAIPPGSISSIRFCFSNTLT